MGIDDISIQWNIIQPLKKEILPYVTTYDEHIDEHGGHCAK